MAGALALFILLAISMLVVRAAGVALRITGLPQQVARLQAISALSGAGFTTTESEALMHHPTRRRILLLLLMAGNLGLVSLASTVILAVTFASGVVGVVVQVVALILAVAVIYALAASSTVDRLMCDAIERVMIRRNWIAPAMENILYLHSSGQALAEHTAGHDIIMTLDEIPVRIVAINDRSWQATPEMSVGSGDTILAIGDLSCHDKFSASLKRLNANVA